MGDRVSLPNPSPEVPMSSRLLINDSMKPTIEAAFTPYYTAMLDGVAAVYASNFSVAEMKDMELFFKQPAGQKYLEKASAVTQQANQVTQDASRKAAEELRARLTQALREKGHKL